MQYIPRDTVLVLASGPIESIWSAIEDQFGPVIRSGSRSEDGIAHGLAKIIEDAQRKLAKNRVEVGRLSDLNNHGIDSRRGVLLGVHRTYAFVAVVPILTASAFKDAFQRFCSSEAAKAPQIPGIDGRLEVVAIKEFYLAFPEPGIAVVSNNLEYLGRSLRDPTANLAYASNNDGLYDSVRQCLGRPLASGSTVFAFIRPDGLFGVWNAGVGVEFDPEGVSFKAQLDVDRDLKLIGDLLTDAPASAIWPTNLPNETAAVFAIHQRNLGPIMGRLGSTEVRGFLEGLYGGFLWTLRDPSAALSRIVIAVTGYRGGLPEILTGIWGNEKYLKSTLQELRVEFRRNRDIEILTALKATADPFGRPTEMLSPEPFATFTRYKLNANGVFEGTPAVEDVENESYKINVRDRTIYYIAPRPSLNDRRFRPGFKKLSDEELADSSTLDRYRMAYVSHEDATWIATDATDLKALLNRKSNYLAESPYFRSSKGARHAQDKLEVFLHIDQLTKLGLLRPESGIQDFARNCLLELREHPAISAQLRRCSGRRGCLYLSARLVRRTALR